MTKLRWDKATHGGYSYGTSEEEIFVSHEVDAALERSACLTGAMVTTARPSIEWQKAIEARLSRLAKQKAAHAKQRAFPRALDGRGGVASRSSKANQKPAIKKP
jgi:hypothetical protein